MELAPDWKVAFTAAVPLSVILSSPPAKTKPVTLGSRARVGISSTPPESVTEPEMAGCAWLKETVSLPATASVQFRPASKSPPKTIGAVRASSVNAVPGEPSICSASPFHVSVPVPRLPSVTLPAVVYVLETTRSLSVVSPAPL